MTSIALFNPTSIKNVFAVLKNIVTEINLVFNEKNIQISGVDPERIAAISVTLNPTTYHPPKEKIVIGINVGQVYRILRTNQKNITHVDFTTFPGPPTTPDRLQISVVKEDATYSFVTTFTSLSLPQESFNSSFDTFYFMASVNTRLLQHMLKDVCHLSEQISIEIKDGQLHFEAGNTTQTRGLYKLDPCPEVYELIKYPQSKSTNRNSYYSKYIQRFCRKDGSSEVFLHLKESGTIGFEYSFDGGSISMILSSIKE